MESITRFWSGYLRTWRFFVTECGVEELADLRRQHIFDYIDHRLALGRAISGVNGDLRALVMFLEFLQGEGYVVPQNLLRIPSLHQPARLPRHLTDEQVRLLRDELSGASLQRKPLTNCGTPCSIGPPSICSGREVSVSVKWKKCVWQIWISSTNA